MPKLLLTAGLFCHSTAFLLSAFQQDIYSYEPLKKIIILLTALADQLWSIPSVLLLLFLILFTPLAYFALLVKKRGIGFFYWLLHSAFLSFIKPSFLFLLFIYTIFPLRWAQMSFSRSPDSFLNYTVLDALVFLLILAGVIFYCFYCLNKLPPKMVNLAEKAIDCFLNWKAPYFTGLLIALCLFITGTIAYTVLDHIPHVQDSIAQLFHAKIFKMGKLYANSHPLKEFFDYNHVINDGKWYSQYPPGHTFLLMLGLFAGAPWLIGPLLGTLSLFVFFHLVKELYRDVKTTYLCSIFLLCSPFFLFMSSSHMNHNATLFFIILFLYCYVRTFSSRSNLPALFAGLSLGYAVAVRPLTAAAIGFPFIADLIFSTFKTRSLSKRRLFILLSGLSLMVLVLLCFNYLTNGDPLVFGYQQKYQTAGFLGNAQGGPPHTLKGGVINTSNNLIGLNHYLFEWPVPSLIFIFVLFLSPSSKEKWDYLFLSAILLLITSYFFYYHQDLIFGPRFYYSLLPFMVILTVRGLLSLPQWLEVRGYSLRKAEATLYLFLTLFFLYTFCVSFPSLVAKYGNDYWWVTDKIHKTAQEKGITSAIVFIDCWNPPDAPKPSLIYYGSGFQFNSPNLDDDVIYALDLKERNSELMKAFPGRQYYRCNFFWDRNVIAW